MEKMTFDGDSCDIAQCSAVPDDAACSKRKADILKKWEEG